MSMKADSILIVDDEKNIRLTLSQALEALGQEIDQAGNGAEALAKLEKKEFGIVLLDLKMPGMDGMEVLRRLADVRPGARTIIISAHGTIDSAVEAMKLGAVDFIQKPFDPKEIRELVARVIQRETLVESSATDYGAFIELAKKSIGERRFDKAFEHVRRAVSAAPSRPEAFNLLGVLQEVRGEHPDDALKNYHAALALDPSYEPAQKNIERIAGKGFYRRGKIDLGSGTDQRK